MSDQRDMIVFVHVTIERQLLMRASKFNLQNRIHVKQRVKQRKHEAKRVKLSRELLSLRQILLSFRLNLYALKDPCH